MSTPAIRTRDGKVFSDAMHFLAYQAAGRPLQADYGFADENGAFTYVGPVDRDFYEAEDEDL